MDFRVGDRVQSTIEDLPGLERGEYGTVVKILYTGDAYIRWDEYNESRHDGYGDIPNGHGWFVGKKWLNTFLQTILESCQKAITSNFYLEMTLYD